MKSLVSGEVTSESTILWVYSMLANERLKTLTTNKIAVKHIVANNQ